MIVAPLAPTGAIGPPFWSRVGQRLRHDRVALACGAVVACFAVLEIAVAAGFVARGWQDEVGPAGTPPAWIAPQAQGSAAPLPAVAAPPVQATPEPSNVDPLEARRAEWQKVDRSGAARAGAGATAGLFGTDRLGRDVLAKTLQGGKTSIFVGVVAALAAVAIGTLLGSVAGYFGGPVGDLLEWLYNVFESIPSLLLIFALAAVLSRGTATIVVILGLTGWTGLYRTVRAEYLRHRTRPYILSAEALGVGHAGRIFRHILPNVSHVILVRLSLLVIAFIKAEVILSFLGFGVSADGVSWGTMIAESQSEIMAGRWWQLAAAGVPMAVFVTAFSMFTDSLRDALDPRLS